MLPQPVHIIVHGRTNLQNILVRENIPERFRDSSNQFYPKEKRLVFPRKLKKRDAIVRLIRRKAWPGLSVETDDPLLFQVPDRQHEI